MDSPCGIVAYWPGVLTAGFQHRAICHLVVDRIADEQRHGYAAGHVVWRGAAVDRLDFRRLLGRPAQSQTAHYAAGHGDCRSHRRAIAELRDGVGQSHSDLCVLFIRSAGGGIQTPAVQSFIPDVAPSGKLLRVNSIYGVINSANMIVAPAVAAVLINMVPLWSILLVDVTTAIIGVGFVAMIKVPEKRTPSAAAGQASLQPADDDNADRSLIASIRRVLADLKAGLVYTWNRPNLRNVVLGDALTCFIAVAPMNLTLLLMAREYEGIDLNLGFITLTTASDKLAANELGLSIGMLLGGAFMSTIGAKFIRNHMFMVALGITLVGVTVVGLGTAPNLLVYLLVDVANGVASAICVGPMRTIMQTDADEKMVGRVFGLDTTLSTLGMPLGMLIFAPLADVIPISLVFIIGGVLTLPIGIYLFGQARHNTSAQVTRTQA